LLKDLASIYQPEADAKLFLSLIVDKLKDFIDSKRIKSFEAENSHLNLSYQENLYRIKRRDKCMNSLHKIEEEVEEEDEVIPISFIRPRR